MIPLIAFVVALGVSGCHAITTDHIYGRDLAQALPAFQSLPPDLVLGLSPFPGLQRTFRAGELKRLAEANQLSGDFLEGVCFHWPMTVPSAGALREAMEKTLLNRNARIEILEQSKSEAPPGAISFPLSGLSGTSDGPVLWRGSVAYAEKKSFSIWAKVRVSVREPHVIATQALKPGDEIRPEQLKVEMYEGPLMRDQNYASINEVIGFTPRNGIASGLALNKSLLRERNAVERGDLVAVTVELNQTHLEAQGIAEESGQRGSAVLVRNPRSGRKFRARVEDKGKVVVLPQGPAGLVTEESRHEAGN